MKISILVLSFFLLSVKICFSQYTAISTDASAMWRVDYYDFDFCGLPQPNAQFQYTFNGDTTINNLTYKKVETSGLSTCFFMGLKGFLRNDTAVKKVYYMPIDSTTEGLLYDFNLVIGDTVPNYFGYIGQQPFIVDSIDTIILGGTIRKRIHYIPDIPSIADSYIIEGLGSLTGIISPLSIPKSSYVLICFSDSNVTIFPDSSTSCQLINKIENYKNAEIFKLQINEGILKVTINTNVKIQTLKIFDTKYSLVKTSTISQIDVSDLNGLFIIEVALENNQIFHNRAIILEQN